MAVAVPKLHKNTLSIYYTIAHISKCFILIHLIFIIHLGVINIPILHMRKLREKISNFSNSQ